MPARLPASRVPPFPGCLRTELFSLFYRRVTIGPALCSNPLDLKLIHDVDGIGHGHFRFSFSRILKRFLNEQLQDRREFCGRSSAKPVLRQTLNESFRTRVIFEQRSWEFER